MMLFEKARENEEAIRQMGNRAIEAAAKAGVPAYYIDYAVGDGIIEHLPDGTLREVHLDELERFLEEATSPGM